MTLLLYLGLIIAALVVDWLIWLVVNSGTKPFVFNNNCPVFLTYSQHGTINLPTGTIFGYTSKANEKVYDIIKDSTAIMSNALREDFNRDVKCFKTEEEAITAGHSKIKPMIDLSLNNETDSEN